MDRVLGFFSSRPNWDSPTPSPAGECMPLRFRKRDTLAIGEEGVGGSQKIPTDERTDIVVLCLAALWCHNMVISSK
jgi:hypothetical protein